MNAPSDENGERKNSKQANKTCEHSLRIDSLCALCGKEIKKSNDLVPILHSSDKLLQTPKIAHLEQKIKNKVLHKNKKLILILDLDQTILHSTLSKAKASFSFQINNCSFYVQLRPHLESFLRNAAKLFEIHVYTMGTHEYAHMICQQIDPTRELFGDRIVSRCENFNWLKKSINRISCISKNVVILDDRADVWDYSKNLIMIRPFWHYNKIDINDPHKEKIKTIIINKTKSINLHDVIIEQTSENKSEDSGKNVDLLFCDGLENGELDQAVITGMNDDLADQVVITGNQNILEDPPIVSNININQPADPLYEDVSDIDVNMGESTIKKQNGFSDNLIKGKFYKKIPFSVKEKSPYPQNVTSEILEEFPQIEKDCELKNIYKILKKTHRKYFKSKIYVEKILSLKVFQNINFICNPVYNGLIEYLGGKVVKVNPMYVIENEIAASLFKLQNIQACWIYECIYQRKFVDVINYIIDDFRETDDYERELEKEFFE